MTSAAISNIRAISSSPDLSLPALASCVRDHLEASIAGVSFSVCGERFAGGRTLIVETLDAPADDAPADLTDPEARRTSELMLRDQVERFGFTRSNILQAYRSCSFYVDVRIGRAYWAALARRRGLSNIVEPLVTLAELDPILGSSPSLSENIT